MSFNIRTASASDGANGWKHRREFVVERIRAFDPDLIGMQECRDDAQGNLVRAALPDYDFFGLPRGGDAETGAEMAPILVRRAAFEPIERGHFWLSETPDVPGSKSWGSAFARIVMWARLRHRPTGRVLTLVNTHFDYVATAIEGAATLLARWLDEAGGASPIILTGDFNADKASAAYRRLADGRSRFDAFRLARPGAPDEGTYHDFGRAKEVRAIDWIVVSEHFDVVEATVDRSRTGELFPSDHYPLAVVLRWKDHP